MEGVGTVRSVRLSKQPITTISPQPSYSDHKIIEAQNFFVQMKFLQSVFLRLSWKNKNLLIKTLLRYIKSDDVLKVVVSKLGSLFTKDVIYAVSQNVHSHVYDNIPMDDNRSIEESSAVDIIKEKTFWYLENSEDTQEKTLIALLKSLGGPGVRKAFIEALWMFTEPKFFWAYAHPFSIPSTLPGFNLSHKRTSHTFSKPDKLSSSTTVERPATFNLIQDTSMMVVAGSSDRMLSFDLLGAHIDAEDWKRELKNIKTKIMETFKVQNNFKPINKTEKLQVLPLWINKKIVLYLDKNSRNQLKNVNEYWTYLVDEVEKEELSRVNINLLINKLKSQYSADVPEISTQSKVPGKKVIKPDKKQQSKKEQNPETSSEITKPTETPVTELPGISDAEKKNIIYFFKKTPLNGNYFVTNLIEKYRYNRMTLCSSDGKFLITTDKSNTMVVHSLVTGCPLQNKFIGHTGPITCLKLHPDNNHFITGSVDATVRLWDFKLKIAEKIFIGHTKTISAIDVNCNYVVSASFDKTIKVFDIGCCIIKWSFEDQHVVTSLLLTLNDKTLIYTGLLNGVIKKYSLPKKKLICQFAMTHTGEIKKMLITSILSHYLITAGADGIIYCFKLTEPQSTPVIKCPHGSSVTSFVVTKHGYILSGCDDGRLRIWDSTTGLLLRVIRPSANLRPIRNVHYLYNQGEDRVLVNLDTDVFLYEFEHIPAAVKEKSNLSPRNRRKSPGSVRQNSPASFSSRLTPCSADGRSTGYQSMAQRKNYGSHQQKFPSVRILHSSCASNQLNYEDHEELVLKCSDHKNYRKEQRMKALSKRCCTLPKIRNKDAYHDTTNAVLLTALKENPRIAEAAVSLIVPPRQSP